MTTAHRPTFDPAKGKDAQRGPAYHQRLNAAHTHLKTRQRGQGGVAGLSGQDDSGARDLRAELARAEEAVARRKAAPAGAITEGGESAHGEKRGHDDDGDTPESDEAKRRRLILEESRDVDADSDGGGRSGSDSESDDDDDDDEEAELLRELAKIKAERAAAKRAEEEAQAARDQEQREIDIARGNPLLNKPSAADYSVKRRWDDDVVFRNQARGDDANRGRPKEFVNDLLRSDFHKKFMVSKVSTLDADF